jgi:hypothetical protein
LTTDDLVTLELFTVVAPFGIRFRDAVTNAVIDDGLSVVVYPPDNPTRRVAGFANRKGVFTVRDLPWLREAESSAGDAAFWAQPPKQRPFVVEVTDTRGRFLPALLNVNLPIEGLYRWEPEPPSSPPAAESPVHLYSAPSRTVIPAMAVVRAELWDPIAKEPAAWAMVEASIDGNVQGRGISDEKGRLLLMFPFPEPKDALVSPPASSPPSGGPTRLVDRTWSVELQAFYAPEASVPEIPDLKKVFEQTQAALWSTLSPTAPLGVQTLRYGSELLLASESQSELWITPLSSP